MPAGRPKKVELQELYFFAQDFYRQFRGVMEGGFRWKFDEEEYNRLVAEIDGQKIQLSGDQNLAIVRGVLKEIQQGRLPEAQEEARLRDLAADNRFVTRDWLHRQASEEARKQVRVPGRPEVMKALLQARTPEEVRTICEDAFVSRTIQIGDITKEVRMPNWPIPVGSPLPRYLSEYASEFLAAKSDPRFPKSTTRPSSQLKQLWFLSRALAGALYGVRTRTAINLVGSMRPEQLFKESRDGKPARKRMRARRRSRHPG